MDFILTNFVVFSNHFNYFHFVLFWRGAISEIPKFLKIWKDPKIDSTMYMKDMLRNWTFPHLLDCGWYLDCLKENTPPLKFEIWEKHELKDLELWRRKQPIKKRLEGGQSEGTKTNSRIQIRDAREGRCPHLIPESNRAWLGCGISSRNSNDFCLDHPNQSR